MIRSSIRDNRSGNKIKPRIMDYIKRDNGDELLEVKDGKVKKTIFLEDFERQIIELRTKA